MAHPHDNRQLFIFAVYWTPWDSRKKQPYGRSMESYVVATDEGDAKEMLISKGAYVDGVSRGVALHYLSENTCRAILRNRAHDWVHKGHMIEEIETEKSDQKDVFATIDFDF